MEMIIDFALLAASAAATIYCFVLSGRLQKLNNMRTGLGAGIAAMSAALDETRRMLAESKAVQRAAEENLEALIKDAGNAATELSELVEALLVTAESAAEEITDRRDEAIRRIAAEKNARCRDRAATPMVRQSEKAA
jgi:hypothetical protein